MISRREVSVTLSLQAVNGHTRPPAGKEELPSKPPLPHALSSHLHALAVAVRAPRRGFSLASHGPSQGHQHMPEFFPCCIVPAAADVPLTAEPIAVICKLRCWDPFLGRRRLERVRCRSRRASASCSPAALRMGLSLCPSVQTFSRRSLHAVRCRCRPCSRLQTLGSLHSNG